MGGMGNPPRGRNKWPEAAKKLHAEWWKHRIARQKEIDASIAAKAEFEYLYDKPYEDKKKVRVAGPFTVESLSPHRVLTVDENDELIDGAMESKAGYGDGAGLRPDDSGKPENGRRAAGAQGRQNYISRLLRHGRATLSAPKVDTSKVMKNRAPKNAPPFSSARSSALFPAPIWSPPPARPGMPALTC